MNEHKLEQALNDINENIAKQTFNQKEILDFKAAADLLCIAKSTLYKLTQKRLIPMHKPFGKKILFKRSELMAIIEGKPIQMNSELTNKAKGVDHE